MKLTYTVPNLRIQDAADLESFLEGRGFDFEAAPAEPAWRSAIDADAPPALPEPEIKHRHKLSEAEVVAVYRRIVEDRRAHRALKGEEYAAEFGIASTTVSRIARGEHSLLTAEVKRDVEAAVFGRYVVEVAGQEDGRLGEEETGRGGEEAADTPPELLPVEPEAGAVDMEAWRNRSV